jgi:SlyX protein
MSDERLTHLEARYVWLERHVREQDKAMVEMGEELRKLRREIEQWRERLRTADGTSEGPEPVEPPPPHY